MSARAMSIELERLRRDIQRRAAVVLRLKGAFWELHGKHKAATSRRTRT